ncbi:hypothetical protein PR001_g31105, partial [Phytophthora rubi]
MFGGSSSDDGGALREAFNAIEEADEEPSPNGSDDSDYQDTPSADRDAKEDEQQDEDDAEEDDENQGGEDDEEESEEDEEEAENEDGDDGEENEEDGGVKEVNELTDQREGDESEQDDEEETDDKFGVAPNLHQIAHQRLKKTQRVRRPFPHFIDGFGTTFDSWADFHEAFEKFQRGTFQQFSKRTSTSVILRNKQIKDQAGTAKRTKKNTRKEMKLLPETWIQYSKTWKCTHGQKYKSRGKGKRKHKLVRGIECSAKVNARVTPNSAGVWVIKVSASGNHNHDLSEHLWESYAENRTVKDSQLANDVAVLHKAGANAKGILQYLRERKGKKTILRDVHNMLQRMKTKENASLTDAQRAFAVMGEFCGQDGCNSAEVLVDSDTNVARVLTFQTAKMKRLFKAFPEVVMVDSTHNTNENRYKLFSFVVHDVFGK